MVIPANTRMNKAEQATFLALTEERDNLLKRVEELESGADEALRAENLQLRSLLEAAGTADDTLLEEVESLKAQLEKLNEGGANDCECSLDEIVAYLRTNIGVLFEAFNFPTNQPQNMAMLREHVASQLPRLIDGLKKIGGKE
jgi:uncharacterized protein YgfB (UPF0149 family)